MTTAAAIIPIPPSATYAASTGREVFKRTHSITLTRSSNSAPFGFTIRGGVEHGLGHFVSDVEKGSEAHLQGIRPGDQIIKCNGMPLHGATHREAVTLISSRQSPMELEVMSTGVIPYKPKKGEIVSWQKIEVDPETVIPIPQMRPNESLDTRIVISLPNSNQGLGCSICKGPPNKPGIFIQSTKPNGLAREAGLRPGDQILDCNGISFQRLDFNDAVYQLKSSKHLDILIRKGAGASLFPSESSGYDSSSSSNAGDIHTNSKLGSTERLPINKVGLPMQDMKKTSEVHENRLKLEGKLLEQERKKLEEEQERLRRDAMRLEAEKRRFEEEKKNTLLKMPASTSIQREEREANHTGTQSRLASAIQDELQRRAAKQKAPSVASEVPTLQRKTHLSTLKNERHDALMAEFKKAHKKMFSSSAEEEEPDEEVEEKVEVGPKPSRGPPSKSSPVVEIKPYSEAHNPERPKPILAKSSSIDCQELKGANCCLNRAAQQKKVLEKPKYPPPSPPSSSPSSTYSAPAVHKSSGHIFKKNPGIPTPDYDSTPDLSPSTRKKFYSARKHFSSKRGTHSLLRPSSSASSLLLAVAQEEQAEGKNRPDFSHFSYMVPAKSVPDFDLISSHSSASNSTAPKGQTRFAKRHPEIDVGSLDSFSIDTLKHSTTPKPPPFYFEKDSDPEPIMTFEFQPSANATLKSVRFKLGEEGSLAAKDYRIANAGGGQEGFKQSLVHQTSCPANIGPRIALSKAGLRRKALLLNANSCSHSSSSDEEQKHQLQRRPPITKRGQKIKSPAPPPPPPPPKVTINRGDSSSLSTSCSSVDDTKM